MTELAKSREALVFLEAAVRSRRGSSIRPETYEWHKKNLLRKVTTLTRETAIRRKIATHLNQPEDHPFIIDDVWKKVLEIYITGSPIEIDKIVLNNVNTMKSHVLWNEEILTFPKINGLVLPNRMEVFVDFPYGQPLDRYHDGSSHFWYQADILNPLLKPLQLVCKSFYAALQPGSHLFIARHRRIENLCLKHTENIQHHLNNDEYELTANEINVRF
jgi:hypothetical protein